MSTETQNQWEKDQYKHDSTVFSTRLSWVLTVAVKTLCNIKYIFNFIWLLCFKNIDFKHLVWEMTLQTISFFFSFFALGALLSVTVWVNMNVWGYDSNFFPPVNWLTILSDHFIFWLIFHLFKCIKPEPVKWDCEPEVNSYKKHPVGCSCWD